MTNEGYTDILTQFFKGVNYTAPTFYFGHGITWDGSDLSVSTALQMTASGTNPPITNPFTDAGGRVPLNFTAGAVNVAGIVKKFTPPVFNFTFTLGFSSGYQDVTYIITAPGLGSEVPPAILSTVLGSQQLPDPPWATGDFLEVVYTSSIQPQ